MTKILIDRSTVEQALEALEWIEPSGLTGRGGIEARNKAITNLRAALAEPVGPVECEPQYANEDGWCDWVCPKPTGYLMQCCDCGLIHEVDFRVAKYQPLPSEAFEVVDDPDLQAQWRMKRRDDISPKQAPQRPAEPVQEPVAQRGAMFRTHPAVELQRSVESAVRPACGVDPAAKAQPVQEPKPVAWRFEARHIDSAWAAAVTLKHPGPEGIYMRNVMPLYAHPPQRKPLTEAEIDEVWNSLIATPDFSRVKIARAIERAHGITP